VLPACQVNDTYQAVFFNRRDCDRGISTRFSQRHKGHPESSGKRDVLKQSELLKHCYGHENALLSSFLCKSPNVMATISDGAGLERNSALIHWILLPELTSEWQNFNIC
jgi:hypothetical protein